MRTNSPSTVNLRCCKLSTFVLILGLVTASPGTPSTAGPVPSLKQEQPKSDQSGLKRRAPILRGHVSSVWTTEELGFHYKSLNGTAVIDQVSLGTQAWKRGLRSGDEIVQFQQETPTEAYIDIRRANRVYRATITTPYTHPLLTGNVNKKGLTALLSSIQANSAPVQLGGQIQNVQLPAAVNFTPPPGYQPPDFHISISRSASEPYYIFNPLDPGQRKAATDWGFAGVTSQLRALQQYSSTAPATPKPSH